MPPRTVTLAVLLFWLATIGWMVYRDQVSETDFPPVFKFDLADEVAATARREVRWEVYFQDRYLHEDLRTGMKREGGLFELSCSYPPKGNALHLAGLAVQELFFLYRVNRKGEVVGLEQRLRADRPEVLYWVEVQADRAAEDSWELHPQTEKESRLCRVPSARGLFNPLHPSPLVAGLYPGQTWSVTAIDPLENARPGPDQGRHLKTARWRARVTSAELSSNVRKLPCWRVDYTAEDGALRARVWVWRLNLHVQQQEVFYPQGTLKLMRAPDRKGLGNPS